MEVIPKTQHIPFVIRIKAAVTPHEVPLRRRYKINKADWEGFAKSVDMGITDIVPIPDNYESFVDVAKKHQARTFPVAAAQAISVT